MVSLQPISATSAYPLLSSQVVSICDLQRLALYWFHAPGLQPDNEVSQSTDQPHGTVCGLPPALRSPDLSESAFKRAPKTHLFSTARRHWDVFTILAPDINIQTYLLTYLPRIRTSASRGVLAQVLITPNHARIARLSRPIEQKPHPSLRSLPTMRVTKLYIQ